LNRRLLSGVSLAVLASAVVANAAAMPVRVPHDEGAAVKAPDPPPPPAPYNWTGFYTGLNVGTAWGSFDPNTASTGGTYFPNPPDVAAINAAGRLSIKPLGFVWGAPSGFGLLNFAGFGDTVHGSGPLAGGQVGANWQVGQWVLGVQGDTAWADVRGENTCFSGLGGINCQRVDRRLSTVTGRLGFAFDRALVYAKGAAPLPAPFTTSTAIPST
jgi:opacity protein-like surface antigen